jgi:hypothetical protein
MASIVIPGIAGAMNGSFMHTYAMSVGSVQPAMPGAQMLHAAPSALPLHAFHGIARQCMSFMAGMAGEPAGMAGMYLNE